jgi:hypothetical protein
VPYGIRRIADVRRFSGSQRSPQYRAPELEEALAGHGADKSHPHVLRPPARLVGGRLAYKAEPADQ